MAEMSEEGLRTRLYELYSKQREVEHRFRRIEQILAWCLALCIIIVVFGAYAKLKRSYTPEVLSRYFTEEASSLAPEMTDALFDGGLEVLPVYAALGE